MFMPTRIQLIDDWRKLAPKLWSMRLMLVSFVLSGVEVALPYCAPTVPSGRFAAAAGLVTVAAAVARLVAQPEAKA